MTNLEAIVLGLVQGLTEFLPISSTAHLRIVPALLGWSDPGAAYSAVIQCGTLAAVIFALRRDISALAGGLLRGILSGRPWSLPESRTALLFTTLLMAAAEWLASRRSRRGVIGRDGLEQITLTDGRAVFIPALAARCGGGRPAPLVACRRLGASSRNLGSRRPLNLA